MGTEGRRYLQYFVHERVHQQGRARRADQTPGSENRTGIEARRPETDRRRRGQVRAETVVNQRNETQSLRVLIRLRSDARTGERLRLFPDRRAAWFARRANEGRRRRRRDARLPAGPSIPGP